MYTFEWDRAKAAANERKHGVSFEEARSVFYDERAILYDDTAATVESRFVLLGMSELSRVLVVVHCERGSEGEVLRIISARKATSAEKQYYPGTVR